MSGKTFYMANVADIPAYLQPDKHFGHLTAFKLTSVWRVVSGFAKDFAIEFETALVAVLAGLAHAMGGLVRTSTTFGSIEPPFSLLIVTPEADPVWPEVPVRFLTHEFSASMHQSLEAYLTQRTMEGCTKGQDPSDTSLKNAAELAHRLYVDGMVERITTGSVLFPFPRSLIDNHVLLTTPPVGLRKALRQLEPVQKFHLENALSTGTRLVAPDGVRSSGVPAFYWQVTEKDLAALLKENPWLIGVPFVIVEPAKPGAAHLDTSLASVVDLHRRCQALVGERHAAKGVGRRITTDDKSFQSYRAFLEEAQTFGYDEPHATILSPRMIAELGLKFTSVLTVLEKKRQPDNLEAQLGLELAKRLAARRQRILSAAITADEAKSAPSLSGLTSRERAVFLRVVERDGLTKTELGRSFNRMSKEERDGILATLVSRNLVAIREGSVFKTAT
jgi:hypothetical protein